MRAAACRSPTPSSTVPARWRGFSRSGRPARRASGGCSPAAGPCRCPTRPSTRCFPEVLPDVIVDARVHKHGTPEALLGPRSGVHRSRPRIRRRRERGHRDRDRLGRSPRAGHPERERAVLFRRAARHRRPRPGSLRLRARGGRVPDGPRDRRPRAQGRGGGACRAGGHPRASRRDPARNHPRRRAGRRGTKVVEVDPRGDPASAFGVSERPERIASGIIEATSSCFQGKP